MKEIQVQDVQSDIKKANEVDLSNLADLVNKKLNRCDIAVLVNFVMDVMSHKGLNNSTSMMNKDGSLNNNFNFAASVWNVEKEKMGIVIGCYYNNNKTKIRYKVIVADSNNTDFAIKDGSKTTDWDIDKVYLV